MDLLAHAFELCQEKQARGYQDGLAQSVVQLIFRYLPQACQEDADPAAVESLQRASILIGSIIRRPAQDICHSLSATVSSELDLPHGKVNPIILTAMLNHLAHLCSKSSQLEAEQATCIQCYASLARTIGLTVADGEDAIAKLALAVRKLRAQVGLPRSISAMLVDETVYAEAVPQMAKRAWLGLGSHPGRPRPSIQDFEQILRDAF